jgi:hypothetical protein
MDRMPAGTKVTEEFLALQRIARQWPTAPHFEYGFMALNGDRWLLSRTSRWEEADRRLRTRNRAGGNPTKALRDHRVGSFAGTLRREVERRAPFGWCKTAAMMGDALLIYRHDNRPDIPFPGLLDLPAAA